MHWSENDNRINEHNFYIYIYIHIYSIWKRKREPEEPKLIWKWKGFHYNATEKFFNGNEHVIMSHSGWDHSIRYFCMRCFGECISNVKKWSKSVQICVCVCSFVARSSWNICETMNPSGKCSHRSECLNWSNSSNSGCLFVFRFVKLSNVKQWQSSVYCSEQIDAH